MIFRFALASQKRGDLHQQDRRAPLEFGIGERLEIIAIAVRPRNKQAIVGRELSVSFSEDAHLLGRDVFGIRTSQCPPNKVLSLMLTLSCGFTANPIPVLPGFSCAFSF